MDNTWQSCGKVGLCTAILAGGGGRGGEPPIPGSKKPGENQQMPFSGQFYLSPYRDNPLWGLQQVNIGAVGVGRGWDFQFLVLFEELGSHQSILKTSTKRNKL